MSAIAFYDSGRLLPYRHDLKQKQIEQRNIDAENTRKYIGYAGGAFANMAERTGTIFGGRLGKAPAVDSEGEPVAKYGGGTVGAEYAKAEWQKGVMDDESERRRVTHKLGLLQENVKYAGLIRKQEAWGDYKEADIKDYYDKRWTSYMEDQKARTMSKTELMRNYKDLFTEDDYKVMEEVNLLSDDDPTKTDRMEKLNTFIPFSKFRTYAEENKYFDPTVASKPRPEVDILMAFLQDEIKFPGMKKIIETNKVSLKKLKDDAKKEATVKDLYRKKLKDDAASKTAMQVASESDKDDEEVDAEAVLANEIPWYRFDLKSQLLLEHQDAKRKKLLDSEKVKPYTAKEFKPGEKENLERYVERYEGNDVRPRTQIHQEDIHIPELDLSLMSNDPEVERKKISNAGNKSILNAVTTLFPKIAEDGTELTNYESVIIGGKRLIDILSFKLANGLPIVTDPDYTSTSSRIRQESMEAISEGDLTLQEQNQLAAEEIKLQLDQEKARLFIESRQRGDEGTGEWEIAWGKISSSIHDTKAWLENLFPDKTINVASELERINEAAKKYIEKPPVAEVAKRTTFRSDLRDPSKLNAEQVDDQVYTNLMTHEDALSDGGVVEDRHRTILTGSVDLWNMVGITEGGKRKLNPKKVNGALDALKLGALGYTNRKSLTFLGTQQKSAILKYLHATDVDSLLGNVKRTGKKLTPSQKQMRKLLTFTPQQTRGLVMWAYNNNMDTLNTNHGFLDQNVYKALPELEQLLGDMAYRFGGSFMKVDSKGYQKLDDALKDALFSTDGVKKNKAIVDMESILFKQGTYKKNNERVDSKGNPRDRFVFLQDRFDRFKERVTGVSVAKRPVSPVGAGTNKMTLVRDNTIKDNSDPAFINPYKIKRQLPYKVWGDSDGGIEWSSDPLSLAPAHLKDYYKNLKSATE